MLLHWSVAVQVLTIDSVLPHPGVTASLYEISVVPQASEPVATPVLAVLVSAGQSSVTFAGQEIEGAVVSCTVMV